MALKRIVTSSLVDKAHDQLIELIARGDFGEGERLVIDKIAAAFGISLIPVREALARLHAEGIIEYGQNKGYRVSAPPTVKEYRDIFSMREMLEVGAIKSGIHNLTDEIISRLESVNDEIAALADFNSVDVYKKFIALNEQFHELITGLPDNRYLDAAYSSLGYRATEALVMYEKGVPDLADNVAEHKVIIDAMKSRDPDTIVEAVSKHINNGFTRFSPSN